MIKAIRAPTLGHRKFLFLYYHVIPHVRQRNIVIFSRICQPDFKKGQPKPRLGLQRNGSHRVPTDPGLRRQVRHCTVSPTDHQLRSPAPELMVAKDAMGASRRVPTNISRPRRAWPTASTSLTSRASQSPQTPSPAPRRRWQPWTALTCKLSGGYAAVTGYSYAVKPCTEGSCENQDLKGLATALEESPISVCVNAGVWNDYTGGVLSAAACGPMGAAYQDHCVMAVGFNATAPKPYWIVRNSWASTWGMQGYIYLEMAKNTCGVADDATIPEVKVDLSEEEARDAAARRAAMFRRASTSSATARPATPSAESKEEPLVV